MDLGESSAARGSVKNTQVYASRGVKQKDRKRLVQRKQEAHLCPGVHGVVPPVAKPSPATDTGVPLLVFGVSGGKIHGIGPPLPGQTLDSLV